MKKFVRVFFVGMLVSFLGCLPLGTLNIAAMQISITDGYGDALWFAAGCGNAVPDCGEFPTRKGGGNIGASSFHCSLEMSEGYGFLFIAKTVFHIQHLLH